MKRALFSAVCVVASTWVTTAAAEPFRLRGQYAFTGSAGCLWAPGTTGATGPNVNPTPGTPLPNAGFCTGPNSPVAGCFDGRPIDTTKAFASTHATEGIFTFNGDGTGSVKGTDLAVTGPPTPGPGGYPAFSPDAGTDTFTHKFTYTVNGDGSWTANVVPGTFIFTFVRGGRAGQTGTIINYPQFAGLIGEDGRILEYSTLSPTGQQMTIELFKYSNGDAWPRICHRSRVLAIMTSER
jgi:hypothetical protein